MPPRPKEGYLFFLMFRKNGACLQGEKKQTFIRLSIQRVHASGEFFKHTVDATVPDFAYSRIK
jgi:hypothetical protein